MTLYSRLFSYRQNEKLSPAETFLTEILGYCLEHDSKFLNDFLERINFKTIERLKIKTQGSENILGRPDIDLFSENNRIIIECKLEASERIDQLTDYSTILYNSNKKNTSLVYLTKYLETKNRKDIHNPFVQLCWYDIAKLINIDNLFFTIEFKNHLKELNIADMKYFNALDLANLKSISNTIEKMDDTLDALRPYYIKNMGGLSIKAARSTRLKDGWYINWQSFMNEKKRKFDITYGYYWFWENDEIPCVGLRVWIPTYGKDHKSNEFFKFFSKELKSWIIDHEIEELNDGIIIAKYKHLSDFMTQTENDEQLKEIIEFLKTECIDVLINIRTKHPLFFTGSKNEVTTDL